jgi:hypothetical protein
MSEKASVILSGTVERIIKSPFLNEPDKAQIHVDRADHLYQEVRIENTLTDENGGEVSLKVGAPVEIKMEAEATSTVASPTR